MYCDIAFIGAVVLCSCGGCGGGCAGIVVAPAGAAGVVSACGPTLRGEVRRGGGGGGEAAGEGGAGPGLLV